MLDTDLENIIRKGRKLFEKILGLEFSYQVGLALFFAIIYGLSINYILPLVGVKDPLSFKYIWPVYFFFIPPLIKLVSAVKSLFKSDFYSWLITFSLIINPVVAVLGVNYLDNTGNGILAIASVALICINFVLIFFKKDGREELLKIGLYSSALSLLLANSLRSNFLVGWDIHQEYLVFRLTSLHNFWDINAFKDAYNTCMSITILPTMIKNLTGINSLTIFRFVYPLIIALIPIVVYQIGNRLLKNKKMAFAAGFIFLVQFQFISQLPALLRQGIAFLFFALMIDVLFRPVSNQRKGYLLFIYFGIGMILSHYSTTYVAMVLLILTKFLDLILKRIFPAKEKTNPLSINALAFLVFLTILWNMVITDTAGGLLQVLGKTVNNVGKVFSLENKSDMVRGLLFVQSSNSIAVDNYSLKTISEASNPEDYEGYEIYPISLNTGRQILFNDPIAAYFHVIIPWIFRASIVIGLIVLLITCIKKRESHLYLSLSASGFLIIAGLAVLPYLSINYNFERLYQQMLVYLAPVSIFGFLAIFRAFRLKELFIKIILTIIILTYPLQTTGVIDHLVYGSSSWMVSSSGEQYYRYYSTVGEISGIRWMEKKTDPNILLYADKYTKLRLLAFSDQKFSYVSTQINPPVIEKWGYIFSGFAGTRANTVFAEANGQTLEFSFPHEYLSNTRNLIYSTGWSLIYK